VSLGQKDVVSGEDRRPLGHDILTLSFEDAAEIENRVDGLVNLESDRLELSDGQVCRRRCRG